MGKVSPLHPSLTTLRAVVTSIHVLTISMTTWRLWYRFTKRRCWWEDAWAAVALLADIVSLITIWFTTDPPGMTPFPNQSSEGRIVAYWLMIICFTICLWAARLSILFSIIRLATPGQRIRKIALWVAACFATMGLGLLVQKLYICGHDRSWYGDYAPLDCKLGTSVGACQIATDFISDLALVCMTIKLLREVNLPKQQRILILSIFSTSIIISLLSVVHVVFIIDIDKYLQVITAQVEIALSLVICNLLVVVTYLYGVFRREDLELDHRRRTRTILFTTVDLDQLTSHPSFDYTNDYSNNDTSTAVTNKSETHTETDMNLGRV
ncbi:hypothetical protein BJ138DRAFT_1006685 [Hygrophoropsis aurantiaca]|uniref:Uncharacterized protein n=1 Tax=Hygrophoropsis aurantiaca TaxID=72124 RepID=A0ACB8AET1_9AGAM|nr:hypothetical protein BJ138DRAFT_1006685 [Hygrophoropsis aurantiaca]